MNRLNWTIELFTLNIARPERQICKSKHREDGKVNKQKACSYTGSSNILSMYKSVRLNI
jgi:hypothetical protein